MVWEIKQDTAADEFDRAIVGGSKRIRIPLGDVMALRHVADALRGLANALDMLSRMMGPQYTRRHVLFSASAEVDMANRKIRDIAEQFGLEIREGRPKNSEVAKRTVNGNGTAVSVMPDGTQLIDKHG